MRAANRQYVENQTRTLKSYSNSKPTTLLNKALHNKLGRLGREENQLYQYDPAEAEWKHRVPLRYRSRQRGGTGQLDPSEHGSCPISPHALTHRQELR